MKFAIPPILLALSVACSFSACGAKLDSTSDTKDVHGNQRVSLSSDVNEAELIKATNENIRDMYTYEDLTVAEGDVWGHKVEKVEKNESGKIVSVTLTNFARLHKDFQYQKTLHECFTTVEYDDKSAISNIYTECEFIDG